MKDIIKDNLVELYQSFEKWRIAENRNTVSWEKEETLKAFINYLRFYH